jgi:similar to spore coat protein
MLHPELFKKIDRAKDALALNEAIATHEKITNYMIAKGFYHPHNLSEQLQLDLSVADTAVNLAQKL